MTKGTYQCPILGCGQESPHAHSAEQQEALRRDRLFLQTDVDISARAVAAAKLLRRALASVRDIGPRGYSQEADLKWSALSLARENFELELYYLARNHSPAETPCEPAFDALGEEIEP
jgi:hypothetical protein